MQVLAEAKLAEAVVPLGSLPAGDVEGVVGGGGTLNPKLSTLGRGSGGGGVCDFQGCHGKRAAFATIFSPTPETLNPETHKRPNPKTHKPQSP